MNDLKTQVRELFLANRRSQGEFQYTIPSQNLYPYQWLWDSCFHAIIMSHFDIPSAKKELLSVTSKQLDNGMLPHILFWEGKAPTESQFLNQIDWGLKDRSTITQPPIIAYAVWKVYSKDKDKEFLKKIYPSLRKYFFYLLKDRDPRGHHLAGITTPDESGEDNSPRFDSLLNLPPIQTEAENFKRRLELVEENRKCDFEAGFCMKNFFWVKDVPFNAILVENLKNLSDIALEIGEDNDADLFLEQSLAVKHAMRTLMLEDGIFYSTWGEDYKKIKVMTWAIFTPLFAGVATPDEADNLVKNHLLNPQEFLAEYPVPSVAMSEKSFAPDLMWRGPTWISANWFIYKGLKKYGFDKEAKEILKSCQTLLEKTGFREYFNPLNGDGGGAKGFTWGGLVLDMLAD